MRPPDPGVPHKPNLQTPDSTLYCVVAGLANKNPQLYEFILPDTLQDGADFHAVFDPDDVADFEQAGSQPPADWLSKDEKTFISQYTAMVSIQSYDVVFTQDQSRPDVPGPSETIFYRHYQVSYGSLPPQLIGYGMADMTFRRVGANQEWKMVRWVDHRDPAVPSARTIGRQRLGPPTVNP